MGSPVVLFKKMELSTLRLNIFSLRSVDRNEREVLLRGSLMIDWLNSYSMRICMSRLFFSIGKDIISFLQSIAFTIGGNQSHTESESNQSSAAITNSVNQINKRIKGSEGAKSERAELQLFSLQMPTQSNAILIFYDFSTELYFYFPQVASCVSCVYI